MSTLDYALPSIPPLDVTALAQVQRELDGKTKPVGSLGRLEQITARYAAIRGRQGLTLPQAEVVVMAADHGVAQSGVSAFPQSVTQQMLQNFAAGGAAINALSRSVGAALSVVNVGALGESPVGVVDARVREGSRNLCETSALTEAETIAALRVGIRYAEQLAERGVTLVAVGEMGIANTTVAACVCAAFCGGEASTWVGRGTGINDATLLRKRDVVERALALHRPDPSQPIRVLSQLGGLEVVALAGLMLGAAARRVPVVLDGFITTAAAVAAAALAPEVKHYLFASHTSTEPGHRLALNALELRPLLDLEFRLGEGTGAALAIPLFSAGVRLLLEMATFESAGVDGRND